ncbi:MAG TPA: asparagine synthase (glutamine-hydrolyzing) [Acidimicrobiales bacterium]|nr:asparagine synthase (glutamine-hydrolyzing) [Acidimicrobiales bacterium]
MCGIAGFLDVAGTGSAPELEAVALSMADCLASRGPDDRGAWVDAGAGVAFGHRRLAVMDLSTAGRQPMVSGSGRYVLSFNGEVYNHRSLRRRLEAAGCSFRGSSDTEVLVEAIDRWGVERVLGQVNGMFAVAVWDRRDRTLQLARDRLGEKPLYYGRAGNTIVFASELRALKAHPSFSGEIDEGALRLFLRLGYIPSPQCIYRGLSKLPPGTVITVPPGRAGDLPEPVPYWSLAEVVAEALAHPFTGSEGEAGDELDALVRDSVALRMHADVPLGAFLSGGVDSSLVTAALQAGGSGRARTFTVGFPGSRLDEAQRARRLAEHLGTDHTQIDLEAADCLEVIDHLPRLYDEPFADPSQIPTALMCAVARRHVTVCLSGDGGDELFAGYNRHVLGQVVGRVASRLPLSVRRAGSAALRRPSPAQWDAALDRLDRVLPSRARVANPGDKVHKLARVLAAVDDRDRYRVLTSPWDDPPLLLGDGTEPPTPLSNGGDWPGPAGPTERMLYLDQLVGLPDDMLTKVDRASMAVGLEVRVPLLDHRLVELAWRLSPELRIRDGQGKWILRRVLDRYVPRQLMDGPKMGFDPPLAQWLRGPLRHWAEDHLDERALRDQGILDPEPIRRRWAEHCSGRRNHDYALWTVLMFRTWHEADGG